jgi:hypothetical protein
MLSWQSSQKNTSRNKMSNLGSNSIWSQLESDIESGNFGKATGDATDAILGPSFDYTAGIQPPSAKGVGSDGTIGQVVTNADAIGSYVSNLTLGPLQGNQSFLNTGGMCTVSDPSDPNNGQTVPRATWVNNRMQGSDVLADFPSLGQALGGDLNTFDGIIPGMMGDLVATNPVTIFNALMLPGTPACQAYSCPTTDKLGNSTGNAAYYMTPGLEASIGDCTRANTASVSGTPGPETFAPVFGSPSFEPMATLPRASTWVEQGLYGLAIVGFVGLLFSKQ